MSSLGPAHLRRDLALLEWIRLEKGDATVLQGSEALGLWRELQAHWSASGGRIRFEFVRRGRRTAGWIGSIERNPSGVRIFLRNPGKLLAEEISVRWDWVENDCRFTASQYAGLLDWVRSRFPGCRILSAGKRGDRALTISGSFFRIQMRWKGRDHHILACGPETPAEAAGSIATQGLIWLAALQPKSAGRLWLVVPPGYGGAIRHRTQFLNSERAKVEVFERHEGWSLIAAPTPPPPEEDRDFRWPLLGPFRWSPILERVLNLAPDEIRRYPRFLDYDSLRLSGLEFARVVGPKRDRILFGIGTDTTELDEENFPRLEGLVHEIRYFRRADSPDTRHPYYRLQSERWLESMILDDVGHIFPELASEAVYPQIPVYLGRDSGRVDILATDRAGTLVVMELKVSEDPELPLQALDYWGRVIQHNACGDFERRGYFNAVRLTRKTPKIYLVAPIFSFHDTTERVLRFLKPEIEIWKTAINHDWRCGVKILRRSRMRCAKLQ